jgi:hypothetical protein
MKRRIKRASFGGPFDFEKEGPDSGNFFRSGVKKLTIHFCNRNLIYNTLICI